MDEERERARKYREEKKYDKAEKIYSRLWSYSVNDKWLSWEYADTVKKLGNLDRAIEVCKDYYKKDNNFKYINDLLSWCLYEKYIINMNTINDAKKMLNIDRIGKFILSIINNDKNTPYERTVFKFLKKYKKPFNAVKINDWLSCINPDEISNIVTSYKDKKGNPKEYPSHKEEWHCLNCKSLFVMKEYNECMEACNNALKNISNFHYDYDIWIKKIQAICISELGGNLEAIKLLKDILKFKEHWTIYDSIFQILIKEQDYSQALIYAYRAALTDDNINLKVNMIEKIGDVLLLGNNQQMALKHYLMCKRIKKENNWSISNELTENIDRLNKLDDKLNKVNYFTLRKFWIKEIIESEDRLNGIILKIMPSGKSGFIKCEKENYYFKLNSVLENKKRIREGLKVSFSLKDSFNHKKLRVSKEAINIYLED